MFPAVGQEMVSPPPNPAWYCLASDAKVLHLRVLQNSATETCLLSMLPLVLSMADSVVS